VNEEERLPFRRPEWPKVRELVVATVDRVTNYGAYVILDEYGKEGLLHISEISPGWVRNIRDFVREGQKLVLKVLRVDPRKGHIDLSLKRVDEFEKRRKFLEWKRERKALGILKIIAKETGKNFDEIYDILGEPLEEEFGELYVGLEAVAKNGIKILIEVGVPEGLAEKAFEVISERIKPKIARVKGIFEIECRKPNGVEIIKEALINAFKSAQKHTSNVKIYTIGAPRYRIEIIAEDYGTAEKALKEAIETASNYIKHSGGDIKFRREK